MSAQKPDVIVLQLQRIHLIVGIVVAILGGITVPIVSAAAAHYSGLAAMNDRINEIRVESAQTLATKSDLKEIAAELRAIASHEAEMAERIARIEARLSK